MTSSQLHQLAAFCVEERSRELPVEVEQAAVQAIIDWSAAALVGARERASQLLTDALIDGSGSGRVSLLTRLAKVDVRTAALINGTAAHVSEIDDIYRDGLYHPGAPTIAAALAMADFSESSGAEFIRAVVMGYEVGCRIARAVNPTHYKYWHTTGTIGAIGSAAAAAEILKLDVDAFRDALATSVTLASGLQQAFRSDSMSKPLHSGRAAEAGVLAALTAAKGFTGAADILDGEAGFGVAMGNGVPTAELLIDLGKVWAITNITVKNHFCCGHTFAPIDGGLEIKARGVKPDDIASIEVQTYTTATEVAGIHDPATAFEAKFSIPYVLATGFLTGSVREKAFTPEALADPDVRRLIGITKVVVDREKDEAYPRKRSARVIITDKSGKVHVADRLTRKGDPDDPLTEGEISSKFSELVEPILGSAAAQKLLNQLRTISSMSDVRTIHWGTK